jgi:UDP-N-acetylmuramate dehydrogenase
MARHTSWRTGGKADRYCVPVDLDDLAVLLQSLPGDEDLLWIGLGSNILVRDGGFRGTVIATQHAMPQLVRVDDCVVVGAGVTSARLAKFCARENLTGAEFFAGIPGLVGGALAMNAGAFGGETWRYVIAVETINRQGMIRQRQASEYQVGYRTVICPQDEWFITATMKFEKGKHEQTTKKIKQLLARRAQTQPTGSANCGSVFRNPEADHAARLIEQSGLKGERIGGAVVSEKHANFIINDNNASARDIEGLIKYVQQIIAEKFNVKLQMEVRIVGESGS